MRRTLALLGVAALAVAGLAGPASASEINADANIEYAVTGLDGTGVSPDTTTPGRDQSWVELKTIDQATPASLAGMSLQGCVGTDSVTFVAEFPAGVEIDATEIFRIGDPGFLGSPTPQIRWDGAATGQLDSVDFEVVLLDVDGVTEVARALHGSPNC